MRRLICLSVISLLSVACGTDSTSTETLAPLPTTGETDLDRGGKNTVVITDPPTTNWVDGLSVYLEFMYLNSNVPVTITDNDLTSYAQTWCDFMERGMSRTGLTSWVNEMASDQEEADLWLVSAEASAKFVCPEQEYKWNP